MPPESLATYQLVLEFAGTFVFALSGALVGVRARFDLLGVLVISGVAGLGGGLLRDMLIGALPAGALQDWRILVVPVVAGLVAFRFHPSLQRIERLIAWFDAVGLGLFCVTGTSKAMVYGLGPVPAVLLGVLTGVGGGLLRDVLVGRTPLVLRQDVYALPALAGALVVAVTTVFGAYTWWIGLLAAALCIVLRLLAIAYRWQIPRPGSW